MPTVEKAPTVAITKRDGLLLGSACTVSALLRILLSHRALGACRQGVGRARSRVVARRPATGRDRHADGTRALRALLVVSPEND